MLSTKLTNISPKLGYDGKTKQVHVISNFDKTYTARFSNLFQPIGHTFTASFDVLKTAYFLKYEIIEAFDCMVYDFIHLFCKTRTPFTLSVIAEKFKVGDDTLRQSLDNLENAELIEIIKVTDEYGTHNCYLLKTPYFERDSINFVPGSGEATRNKNKSIGKRREEILEAGFDLPTEFLENHADRLKRQVEKNKAKRLRQFLRNKAQTAKHPIYAEALAQKQKERSLLWKQVARTLNDNAASFDEFIYRITPEIAGEKTNAGVWSKLRERVKKWCLEFKIKYDDVWHPDIAKKLFDFFRKRLGLPGIQPPAPAAPPPPPNVSNATDDRRAEEKQRDRAGIRKLLAEKRDKAILPRSSADLKRFFNNVSLGALSFDEFLAVVKEFFTPTDWQKLTVELRR